jgi:hypothetical protein
MKLMEQVRWGGEGATRSKFEEEEGNEGAIMEVVDVAIISAVLRDLAVVHHDSISHE